MTNQVIKEALKRRHLSITQPRLAVYELLSRSEPLTMQELIAALPHMDPTTVYRTVALFEVHGVAQRLQIGWKYKLELSNEYQDHHHHITCVDCGETVALPEDDPIEVRLHAMAIAQGYVPLDHQLEVRGRCKSCART